MELFLLHKIEVVSAPMVRTEQRYRAFSDGLLDWYFRLVGHQVWREIQIADKICQIFQKYYKSTCSNCKWWQRCQSSALNNARSHNLQKWHQQGIHVVVVLYIIFDLNFPPSRMSFQSEIHCKISIFNPKSHAPETSKGSESTSILLVRLFYICQANFPSLDILSLALAERGFRGGLI